MMCGWRDSNGTRGRGGASKTRGSAQKHRRGITRSGRHVNQPLQNQDPTGWGTGGRRGTGCVQGNSRFHLLRARILDVSHSNKNSSKVVYSGWPHVGETLRDSLQDTVDHIGSPSLPSRPHPHRHPIQVSRWNGSDKKKSSRIVIYNLLKIYILYNKK